MGEHTIKMRIADSDDSNYSTIKIDLDGKQIADGSYGGEPEDNCRTRDYRWVQGVIHDVAEALGARVEVVYEELADDE
ncbi:MAG: hypothetical protein WC718_16330 [Phycisphaerales bacterium]|jgi:hypothetical protein